MSSAIYRSLLVIVIERRDTMWRSQSRWTDRLDARTTLEMLSLIDSVGLTRQQDWPTTCPVVVNQYTRLDCRRGRRGTRPSMAESVQRSLRRGAALATDEQSVGSSAVPRAATKSARGYRPHDQVPTNGGRRCGVGAPSDGSSCCCTRRPKVGASQRRKQTTLCASGQKCVESNELRSWKWDGNGAV